MKEVYFMIGLVFLFYACSSPDEGKSALVSNDIEGRPSVELVSVDSCFTEYESDNPTAGVKSFLAVKKDDFYTVRVLGVTQCPPAEKPDYLEYSYEDDTLVLNIDKMNRSYDVTCSCMFWADVLIKGNLSFDKIQISGNVFSVLENDL
ncbi:hypothetical protein [Fibrobacter sp.]|uniref:hypothetical protein n=1 Tax=Fibrobacter sp. TaxID=35828 RepID=UPI00388FB686